MGGLKSWKKDFIKRENAVSETMGVALLLGIVVIMLSFEGAFIFARGGPDDLPHASLQEWMDTTEDTIYLKHCSGEPIKVEELEIVASINGTRYVCNSSEVYTGAGNNGYWELGEVLEINASSEWGLNIQDYHEVDLYLVDTPTKELIQKSRLTTDFRKAPYKVGWITPSGGANDTSPGGSAYLADVQRENDTLWTTYKTPTKNGTETDPDIYEEFDYGVNPCMYGFRPGDSLTNVTLKIVYRTNDNSLLKIQLRFYDVDNPSNWFYREITLPEKNAFTAVYISLTEYINTAEDLANFTVRLEAVTNANEASGKEVNIDYLGLWIE
ncbi:type IV pilin [Methanosarcina sp. DH2]|jgi:FlaG/FlaF family flagellin (archaellin)|uniref:type IV pilin N-terminal domain-containing protein n=1 Tax=Methanosarcina sp. DH2 TaxID=2605639 RepID=UPI001E60D067|nr:type IV pilin N-terminal domain-containing protein [Methanosarcina sp. DH2]MCC4769805.1 type IV pilin [Methanosarcina sp. DH2]